MHIFADAIIVLWGWRRIVAALIAGACSALALPSWSVFPILWLTIPVLVWLIDGAVAAAGTGVLRRLLPGAIVGWSFGFGYFLAGFWWIGAVFPVSAGYIAWLMPVAAVALAAALALFWSFGAVLARLFWPDGWPRILVFAVAFSLAEWLRGNFIAEFPWNTFGYTLTPSPVMMQSAAIVGIWGLTFAAFIIFAAPALLASPEREGRDGRHLFLAFAAAIMLAHVGFGVFRLAGTAETRVTDVRLRIVQPAIEPEEYLREGNEDAMFRRYLQLSDSESFPDNGGIGGITLLVWPEGAIPFVLTDRPDALAALATLLPDGTTLLTGAIRAEHSRAGTRAKVYNSVYAIGDNGEILSAYDKVRLMPFGEVLPFQSIFEAVGIGEMAKLGDGFSQGARHRTLSLANAPPFSPVISQEIIFTGAITDPSNRPEWILNLTDDARLAGMSASRQLFMQSRVRAVEEGLPVVRAASSGISAIVDANGRVVAKLGKGLSGLVDSELPISLPPTPYRKYGGWIFIGLLVVSLGAATIGPIKPVKRRN